MPDAPAPTTRPYGLWDSPIDAHTAAAGSIIVQDLVVDGADIGWVEMRPSEGGRYVPVRVRAGAVRAGAAHAEDLLPAPWNVRNRVNEYGGGSMQLFDGVLFFVNFADQCVYRFDPASGDEPEQLTETADGRFADFAWDRTRERLIAVREVDDPAAEGGARQSIAAIDLRRVLPPRTRRVRDLASDSDFFAAPTLDPSGLHLAWIGWRFPNMPWDGTELLVARIGEDGRLGHAACVAGGRAESILEPRFSPGGQLHYLTDRSGFWSLERHAPTRPDGADVVFRVQKDLCAPGWKLGQTSYAISPPLGLLMSVAQRERTHLVAAPGSRGGKKRPEVLDDSAARINAIAGNANVAAAIMSSTCAPTRIVRVDPTSGEVTTIRVCSKCNIDAAFLPEPQSLEIPAHRPVGSAPPTLETSATSNGEDVIHAWYYPPANPDFASARHDRPPLIVRAHGGPTGQARLELNLEYRFWTSRGFAILDVDYGGSAGYGRAYRELLRGQWGIVDVADCTQAALHVAEHGRADASRLIVAGGSAGGFTTLMCLACRDVFAAGANFFGVADLVPFRTETHRFESRYLDGLIGQWPDQRERYTERSPLAHADGINRPLIVFQGDEDRVVPPEQSERIVTSLQKRGIRCEYYTYAGEQHGFRDVAHIAHSLNAQLAFFIDVLGIGDPERS